eukprot:424623_1
MGSCCQSEQDIAFHSDKAVHDTELHDIKKLYTFGRVLGRGASCIVVEGTNNDNPQQKVAIKVMGKFNDNTKKLYQHEVTILSKLSHQSILRLLGHGEDFTGYYIITDLLSGGELFDRITSSDTKSKFTEQMACAFVLDMLQSVKYCHDNGIIHRDLKPENWVFANDDIDSKLILIDFGSAISIKDDPDQVFEKVIGTPDYMSPENAAFMLKRKGCKPLSGHMLKASDVWGMGALVYVMMTGTAPFRGDTITDILEAICDNPLQFQYEDPRYHNELKLSEYFQDFILKVLNKDPMQRMTIDEAIQHPWVQGKSPAGYVLNKAAFVDMRQVSYQSQLKQAMLASEREARKTFIEEQLVHNGGRCLRRLVYICGGITILTCIAFVIWGVMALLAIGAIFGLYIIVPIVILELVVVPPVHSGVKLYSYYHCFGGCLWIGLHIIGFLCLAIAIPSVWYLSAIVLIMFVCLEAVLIGLTKKIKQANDTWKIQIASDPRRGIVACLVI